MADSFHLNIEEASPLESLRKCGEDLAHFHLCETNRRTLGTGHLDFAEVFRTLIEIGYRGYYTIITEYDTTENWYQEADTSNPSCFLTIAEKAFVQQLCRHAGIVSNLRDQGSIEA
jgi:sugar phosphate isomerase/epimerase